MSGYKTLKEMSDAIGLNYSTARGYVDRFKSYFPTQDMPDVRWPVYEAGAQAILKLIKDVYDSGGGTHTVRGALEERYGTIIDHQAPDNDINTYEPITAGITRTVELLKAGQVGIEYAMSSLRFYRDIIHAKEAEIDHLRKEIERLKQDGAGDQSSISL